MQPLEENTTKAIAPIVPAIGHGKIPQAAGQG